MNEQTTPLMRETYYTWMERVGDNLQVPQSNYRIYEDAFDYKFSTVEEAVIAINELGADYNDNWVLTQTTIEVLVDQPTIEVTWDIY